MRARHFLFAALVALALTPGSAARADIVVPDKPETPPTEEQHGKREHGPSDDAREQRAVGEGSDEHHAAEAEHEHPSQEAEGIVNWWSWDYGEKTADPSHRGWPPPFGWALVNFLIFLGVLSKILWAPLKAGFVERHETIKGELAEARRLHQEAEAQLAEFQRKVSSADKEVADLLALLRKEAENDRARLVAAAEAEAQRLKEDADRQIRVEIERARAELRRGAVEAAIAAAEEILKKGVTADDQRRLVERYVADVEKVTPSTKGVAS